MLVFDQLKKDDAHLRWLAVFVLAGLGILLGGLWWIQVVSTRHFQEKLEIQSIRTVRIPAVRGRILDRNGLVLAENQPAYSIGMYLEDLSKNFQAACSTAVARARSNLAGQKDEATRNLGHRPSTAEQKQLSKQYAFTTAMKGDLEQQTRYLVASNIISDLGARLKQPLQLQDKAFQKHYSLSLAMPMPVISRLREDQIASFEEQSMHMPGLDLEVQSLRHYPQGTLAAHILGYVMRNTDSIEGEPAEYNYRLEDYAGLSGIEKMFDKQLHGTAGGKSVLVNNWGYRQSETVWQQSEPGHNLVLTIDLNLQQVAETALAKAQADVRGAVVVLDARNGDVLVMASAPSYDPNHFVKRYFGPDPSWNEERWNDKFMAPQKNRAMYENFHPGSIFKIVVGLAALEGGLDPEEIYPGQGYIMVGKRRIDDLAGVDNFNFKRAFARSSNAYFIYHGMKPGVFQRVLALGQQLHLGELTGLIPRQETDGSYPNPKKVTAASGWFDGDTANLCIGQGKIDVTPLQMAIMTAAIANGGKVFWPRLVAKSEPADGIGTPTAYLQGRVRDQLRVSQKSLNIVRQAMLEDVESSDGSGHGTYMPGWRIAGKTGTAEVERGGRKDSSAKDTWFVSYAPYENPRYVVVVMVEGGNSGGKTCVPVVHEIYKAIVQRESGGAIAQQTGGARQ